MLKFHPCYKINKKLSPAKYAGFSFFRKSGIIFIFYIFLEVIKMLYEVLYETGSENYSKGEIHFLPLVLNTRRALKAISDCDIEKLQNVLYIAEKEHSNEKYNEDYKVMKEKLQKVLNFIKNFYKHFPEMVDESVFDIPSDIDFIIAGNIINLITQDGQLGFEESLVILHSLRPIANRLPTGGHELMANIYFTGLSICETHNVFGLQFAMLIRSEDKGSVDFFIRGYSPRLNNIVYSGLSSILHSKAEIRRLDNDLKKDLKRIYKSLIEKRYRFSLVERFRAFLL